MIQAAHLRVFFAMRVALQLGRSLDLGVEFAEDGDFGLDEGERGGLAGRGIARLEELKGDGGGLGGDGGELDEAVGGFELTVFEAQTLKFEQPPELLDVPAHFVPVDDLPGG